MEFVVNISCPDKPGLVHQISQWVFKQDCNILDSDQFTDPNSNRFFMRVHFAGDRDHEYLDSSFSSLADRFDMDWQLWKHEEPSRILVMVSKLDHCLVDLIYRTNNGELPVSIDLVVSNHENLEALTHSAGIEFSYRKIGQDNKAEHEQFLQQEIEKRKIDFIVLARYMQILSADFCRQYPGRVINIHHSFLPSFKGARPYQQAHQHGVKLIGATAHYVTEHLDEGPIIEQSVERVDHRLSPANLAAVGRDVERLVLAKAVRYQAEHRVFLNGNKTVVFH